MKRVCMLLLLVGCGRRIPDPQDAVRSFARACERGDAAAVRARLSAEEQRTHDAASIQKMLGEGGADGRARCHALASEPLQVEASAAFVFASGDTASVVIEDGAARVAAAGALPGGGVTPAAALASFRASLLRWLAGSALGPLTESSRTRNRARVQALADGLANTESLFVEVLGDRARVEVQPGHQVSLRREQGLWRVETFE